MIRSQDMSHRPAAHADGMGERWGMSAARAHSGSARGGFNAAFRLAQTKVGVDPVGDRH